MNGMTMSKNVDFTGKCLVSLMVNNHEVSGLFITSKDELCVLRDIFKQSDDHQTLMQHDGAPYVTSFIDSKNASLKEFMESGARKAKELAQEFYKKNGFYEQECDIWDVWEDSDIDQVLISFPREQ